MEVDENRIVLAIEIEIQILKFFVNFVQMADVLVEKGGVCELILDFFKVEFVVANEVGKVDDLGLHIRVGGTEEHILDVDHVILCAGQESVTDLIPRDAEGKIADKRYHVIGGAKLAGELDARRAIREGAELAARL